MKAILDESLDKQTVVCQFPLHAVKLLVPLLLNILKQLGAVKVFYTLYKSKAESEHILKSSHIKWEAGKV